MAIKKVRKWSWRYGKYPRLTSWELNISSPHEDDWYENQWTVCLVLFGFFVSIETHTEEIQLPVTGSKMKLFLNGKELGQVTDVKYSVNYGDDPFIKVEPITFTARSVKIKMPKTKGKLKTKVYRGPKKGERHIWKEDKK